MIFILLPVAVAAEEGRECDGFGLEVKPFGIDFGTVSAGGSAVGKVTLRRTCSVSALSVSVNVEDADASSWLGPEFGAKQRFDPGQSELVLYLALRLPPSAPAGEYKGSVLLIAESAKEGLGGGTTMNIRMGTRIFYEFEVEADREAQAPFEEDGPRGRVRGVEEINFDSPVLDIRNRELYSRLRGRILIKPEDGGRAYYVHPGHKKAYFLGRPEDAFAVMREQGVGINSNNLAKFPEETEKNFSFGSFVGRNLGRIFLDVEKNGEAWYVNPADGRRYFLGRPKDAFQVMRSLGLGISNADFEKLISVI